MTDDVLRPLERRVRRLTEDGVGTPEIAGRFRRSPEFIERVLLMSALPGRVAPDPIGTALRPVERRVLRWLSEGAPHTEIARRFQRSPDFIERVEVFARSKLARGNVPKGSASPRHAASRLSPPDLIRPRLTNDGNARS